MRGTNVHKQPQQRTGHAAARYQRSGALLEAISLCLVLLQVSRHLNQSLLHFDLVVALNHIGGSTQNRYAVSGPSEQLASTARVQVHVAMQQCGLRGSVDGVV